MVAGGVAQGVLIDPTNAGGVRASLDPGPLTYGALYETFPFDNRFATVRIRAGDFRDVLADNLGSTAGTLILSGLTLRATCHGDALRVQLRDARNRPVRDNRMLTVLTSDDLATTSAFESWPEGAVTVEEGRPMRDESADLLAQRTGERRPESSFDPAHPRFALPSRRPVSCGEAREPSADR